MRGELTRREMNTEILMVKLVLKVHLEDLEIDGRIILTFSREDGDSTFSKTTCKITRRRNPQSYSGYVLNVAFVWNVAPRGDVGIDRRLRGAYCLHHQGYHRNRISFITCIFIYAYHR
jgi:hypothetical protein